MTARFYILLFAALIFLSCGRRDEKNEEYTEDKTSNEEPQKNETKKQDTTTSQTDKRSDNDNDRNNYTRVETPIATISPLEATGYMGKYVTVKGLVADVYRSDKVAYLNFMKKYPDNPFSGVIFAREFDAFGDLSVYENKHVEITGRVSTFRGKPQMILDKPSQIKIGN